LLPALGWIAKISSICMALSFGTILYAGFVMSETVFMVFFLLFIILFFQKKYLFSGICLGIVSLIRPVGHFLLPLMILFLLFSKDSFMVKITHSVRLCFSWLLMVSWWLFRNFLLTGSLFFHSMSGNHFLIFFAPDIVAQEERSSFHEARTKLQKERDDIIAKKEKLLGKKLSDFEQQNVAQAVANIYLQKYPLTTFKRAIFNIVKTLFGFHSSVLVYKYSSNFPGYRTSISWWDKFAFYLFPDLEHTWLKYIVYAEIVWMLIIFLGFAGSIVCAFFNEELFGLCVKTLPIITFFVFLTLGIGLARLRFPVEPFLIINAIRFYTLCILKCF
jgi:hypothetical protein